MCREAIDDFRRFRRDREVNSTRYKRLTRHGIEEVPSSSIKVSDFIIVEKVCSFHCVKYLFTFCRIYPLKYGMILFDINSSKLFVIYQRLRFYQCCQ